jgi:hypothetical protein
LIQIEIAFDEAKQIGIDFETSIDKRETDDDDHHHFLGYGFA